MIYIARNLGKIMTRIACRHPLMDWNVCSGFVRMQCCSCPHPWNGDPARGTDAVARSYRCRFGLDSVIR